MNTSLIYWQAAPPPPTHKKKHPQLHGKAFPILLDYLGEGVYIYNSYCPSDSDNDSIHQDMRP